MAIVKSEKLGLENQNTQPTQIYTLLLAIWYWSPYPPPFFHLVNVELLFCYFVIQWHVPSERAVF